MKRAFFLSIFVVNAAFAFGQNIIEDVTALMKAGMVGDAEELVNRYLMQDPINVDAIMMKGNVVLNKYLYEQQLQGSVRRNFFEDVYDAGTVEKGERPVTVPDLFCTLCQSLKINPRKENIGPLDRPIKLVDGGTAVKELF